MNIPTDAEVIGMICVEDLQTESVLVVSENGYGKRSAVEDYRITNRGGKGVKTLNITDKTGKLIAIKNVVDENELMIINRSGIAIRMKLSELRVMGRATQGVKLINLKGNDTIAAVAKVEVSEEDETLTEGEENLNENGVEGGTNFEADTDTTQPDNDQE